MDRGISGLATMLKVRLEGPSRDLLHIASAAFHWAACLLQSSIFYANLRLLHSKRLGKMGILWHIFSYAVYNVYWPCWIGSLNLLTDTRESQTRSPLLNIQV
jgi:hypothetical protein